MLNAEVLQSAARSVGRRQLAPQILPEGEAGICTKISITRAKHRKSGCIPLEHLDLRHSSRKITVRGWSVYEEWGKNQG